MGNSHLVGIRAGSRPGVGEGTLATADAQTLRNVHLSEYDLV